MRDGAAERRLRGRCGIDMDELTVLGRVGEGVDPRLVDGQPGRDADLLADAARISSRLARGIGLFATCVRRKRHQKGSGAVGWSDARTSCSLCAPSRSISARRIAERLRGDLVIVERRVVIDELVGRARPRRRRRARSGRACSPSALRQPPPRPRRPRRSSSAERVCRRPRDSSVIRRALACGEVVDLALEQLGVGHDQLLAGQRAQPRRLEADPLDRAGAVVVADRVAAS